MRCSRSTFLFLALAAILSGGCTKEFKSFESLPRARVKLPEPVHSSTKAVPWGGRSSEEQPPPVTVYYHEDKDGTYLVSAYPVSGRTGEPSRNDDERLHEASNAIREHFKIPDGHWSEMPIQRRSAGLEISYNLPQDDKQYARTRLFLVEGTLYNLTVVGKETWVKSDDARKFLDSFELKTIPEAGAK
jgi:hypothetical protein